MNRPRDGLHRLNSSLTPYSLTSSPRMSGRDSFSASRAGPDLNSPANLVSNKRAANVLLSGQFNYY